MNWNNISPYDGSSVDLRRELTSPPSAFLWSVQFMAFALNIEIVAQKRLLGDHMESIKSPQAHIVWILKKWG